MKTSSTLTGGVRFYVSIVRALFPAIVFLMISANPLPVKYSRSTTQQDPIVARIRQIYTSQIGIREKPINSGPQVEKYLKYVGLGKGNPWCAAFVCWVLGEAGVGNPRTGWSPALFGQDKIVWARGERGKVKGESVHRFAYSQQSQNQGVSDRSSYPPIQTSDFRLPTSHKPPFSFTLPTQTSDFRPPTSYKPPISFNLPTQTSDLRPPTSNLRPQTGDIFGLYFPEKGRIAHTGFIDQWDGTWMITVEGNTNIAGSREGDGVYRKRRLVRSVYQVARYINY